MAITGSVEELMDARGFGISDQGVWTGSRRWRIRLDLSEAETEEMAAIEAHVLALVPVVRYESHPGNPSATARSISVQRLSLDLFEVSVPYSTGTIVAAAPLGQIPTGTGGPNEDRPTPDQAQDKSTPANQRYPRVWYTRHERKKPLEKDAGTGVPVENAAGDPYDPPLEVDRSKYCINIQWWADPLTFDLERHLEFFDKTNDDTVTIRGIEYPTRSLRVLDLNPQMQWEEIEEEGQRFTTLVWELSAVLLADKDTLHDVEVLNAGKRELDAAGKAVVIIDDYSQPVADPVPLDADGKKLAPDGVKVYHTWRGYVPDAYEDLLPL